MKSQVWWYTARAGGTVAWALSAVSVVWGLLLSSRVLGKRISGPKLMDLHRFLGGLAVVFTGVHLAGLFFDSYVHFGLRELFLPFASEWQPNAVAWGVVALYLLVAVEVTSLLRRRVGERVWRATHYLGFAVFVLGTIHGLKAGTDVSNPLLWWPAAGLSAAIIGLSVARVSANGDPVPSGGVVRAPKLDEAVDITVVPEPELVPVSPEPALLPPPAPETGPKPEPVTETDRPMMAPVANPTVAPEISVLERTIEALMNLDEAPPMGTTAVTSPERQHDLDPATAPSVLAQPSAAEQSVVQPAAEQSVVQPAAERSIWSPPVVESHSVPTEPLAVRAPKRLAVTTEPATSLTSWQPATSRHRERSSNRGAGSSGVSTVERAWPDERAEATPGSLDAARAAGRAGPPLPPTEVDPVTGEPDPQAYRKWLKEWLAYVESQV